jgi:putative acetyltransferase
VDFETSATRLFDTFAIERLRVEIEGLTVGDDVVTDEIAVRSYVPTDCGPLIEVFRDSVRGTGLRHYSLEQVLAWAPDEIDYVRFGARRANRMTWVAEIGGRPVGFADLELDGHIDMLFVHPDFQRRGVASALLEIVVSTAHERGLKRLYTESSIGARSIFERFGFLVQSDNTVAIGKQVLSNFRMEKTER